MSTPIHVNRAFYGAVQGISTGPDVVKDITAKLQGILDSGQLVVQFGNGTFNDPCPGYTKGFYAEVSYGTQTYFYNGAEGQTVNFSVSPQSSTEPSGLILSNLTAALHGTGAPTPATNYVFSSFSFLLTNKTALSYPPNNYTSAWVGIDFYLTPSNSPLQPTQNLVKIGDIPLNATMTPTGSINKVVNQEDPQYDLYNMSRTLAANPGIIPTNNYYLYAQARRTDGSIVLSSGSFTPISFHLPWQQ